MTYEQFLGEVPSYLSGRLPADTQIHIRTVLKNNDYKCDGLVISEPGNSLSPTIYLNPFSEYMTQSDDSFDAVMERLLDLYRRNRMEKSVEAEFFLNYELAKTRITCRLVSKERNKELLSDVPYVEFLDLAVVFQYYLN